MYGSLNYSSGLPIAKDEVGRKIDYPGLTYAPINEQGVVLLFAMMSDDLGFSVEAIRQAFPDALVVDYRGNRERGVKKRIEFEFKSSHFSRQKHDSKECDIIVCWDHDWKNCPIEVIELRSVIQKDKGEQVREELPKEKPRDRKVSDPKVRPDYMTDWNARMGWTLPDTRNLATELILRLRKELSGVTYGPQYRWYCFYKGQEKSNARRVFAVLLGKKTLRLAMRYRPAGFKDPENLTHMVAGWFFPRGNERRVSVTPQSFESVVRIAKSTYEGLAGWFD